MITSVTGIMQYNYALYSNSINPNGGQEIAI